MNDILYEYTYTNYTHILISDIWMNVFQFLVCATSPFFFSIIPNCENHRSSYPNIWHETDGKRRIVSENKRKKWTVIIAKYKLVVGPIPKANINRNWEMWLRGNDNNIKIKCGRSEYQIRKEINKNQSAAHTYPISIYIEQFIIAIHWQWQWR